MEADRFDQARSVKNNNKMQIHGEWSVITNCSDNQL